MTTKSKHGVLMSLASLTIEQGHGDRLRELQASMLKLGMEAEVSEQCGAGHGERGEGRVTLLDGHREQPLGTRLTETSPRGPLPDPRSLDLAEPLVSAL